MLAEQDLQELRQSAITEQIAEEDFKTVNGEEALEIILGPYFSRLGGHSSQYYTKAMADRRDFYSNLEHGGWAFEGAEGVSLKPRIPRISDGKPIKYESVYRTRPQPFVCESSKKGLQSKGLVAITEGSKKAASIASADQTAMGLSGVTGWRTRLTAEGKKLHESYVNPEVFQHLTDRKVALAFDQDQKIKTRKYVAYQLWQLMQVLQASNCRVQVCEWAPEWGKGIDDVHASRGKQAVQDIIESAKPFNETDFFKFILNPGQSELAAQMLPDFTSQFIWVADQARWFRYQPQGYWKPLIKNDEVLAWVGEYIRGLNLPKSYDSKLVTGTFAILRNWRECRTETFETNHDRVVVAMPSFCLDVTNKQQLEPSQNHRLTTFIPYDYNPEAKSEIIQDWLLDISEGDYLQVQTIRAFMWLAIHGDPTMQKFLQLIGPGGTGKSTVLKMFNALVGVGNYVSTDLKYLEGGRFEGYNLIGRKLITIGDAGKWWGDPSVLKSITASESIRIEAKNQQGDGNGYTFQGVLVMACNQDFRNTGEKSSIARRRVALWFPKSVPAGQRRDLLNIYDRGRLTGEFAKYMPDLLNWVLDMTYPEIEGLLRADGYLESERLRRIKMAIETESSSVMAWLEQCCQFVPGHRTLLGAKNVNRSAQYPSDDQVHYQYSRLYPSYCGFCFGVSQTPLNRNNFQTELVTAVRAFNEKITKVRVGDGIAYEGIAIKPRQDK